jgi:ribonuclease VapC
MIIDTSALLAILLDESDSPMFARAIANAGARAISSASFLEAAIVIDGRRQNEMHGDGLELLVQDADIEIVPVSAVHARAARDAYRRYGKGNHRAGLNFGDCFAYALAKETGRPLLYKGADFACTDIQPAL